MRRRQPTSRTLDARHASSSRISLWTIFMMPAAVQLAVDPWSLLVVAAVDQGIFTVDPNALSYAAKPQVSHLLSRWDSIVPPNQETHLPSKPSWWRWTTNTEQAPFRTPHELFELPHSMFSRNVTNDHPISLPSLWDVYEISQSWTSTFSLWRVTKHDVNCDESLITT